MPGQIAKTALILVDVQNDFCPGGALPVAGGDKVVPLLNEYMARCRRLNARFPIYATRDWHPARHCSFKPHGGIWPVHCVQGTRGAEFHPQLALPPDAEIISKGTDPDQEAYSGFQGTTFRQVLASRRVTRVLIGGLATDYCVKSTVLDALTAGFKAVLLTDASRGVEIKPGDSQRAVEEMQLGGAVAMDMGRFAEVLGQA